MELTIVTVRTASRMPIGRHAFQEVGVSLTFSVRDQASSEPECLVSQAGEVLERAFHVLWRKLDGQPVEQTPP